MKSMKSTNFQFKKIMFLTPFIQISILAILFIGTTILANQSYQKTGLLFGNPLFTYMGILFAPIYEEIIFRGIIFQKLLKGNSVFKAIILSSIIFGLWHIKNIFFQDMSHLISQVLYTTFIFGPLMCLIAYKTKTIWIGSIIHYLNNFIIFFLTVNGIDWGISFFR